MTSFDCNIAIEELLHLEELNEEWSDPEDDDILQIEIDSEHESETFQEDPVGVNVFNQTIQQEHASDNGKKYSEFTVSKKLDLVQRLLLKANQNYALPRGAISAVATEFGCHRVSASRIWNESKKQLMETGKLCLRNNKIGRVGRKMLTWDEDYLKSIPQKFRTTIRSFAHALGVSTSVVMRMLSKGIIRSHTNSIKPQLNTQHKLNRILWVVRNTIPRSIRTGPRFECMTNLIHLDEKWFVLSKTTQKYYLLAGEEEPLRTTQSKNFIPKCMFLAAIARPLFDSEGKCLFDGKIGIWPFTEIHIAQRSSVNRPAGTEEVRALQSITRAVIKQTMIQQLIPAIKAKWPATSPTKCIWIQQDNARPHISTNDPEFLQAANTDGFEMHLISQPAQSPDLNCLDLGFFRAIQAIQHQQFPKDTNELIIAVKKAYEEYDPKKINFTWLQLQYVMLEILKDKGGNNYKNPHKGKERLERIGQLPFQVEVPTNLLDEAISYLNEAYVEVSGRELLPDEVDGYELLP